jgi:hypothetical protein
MDCQVSWIRELIYKGVFAIAYSHQYSLRASYAHIRVKGLTNFTVLIFNNLNAYTTPYIF